MAHQKWSYQTRVPLFFGLGVVSLAALFWDKVGKQRSEKVVGKDMSCLNADKVVRQSPPLLLIGVMCPRGATRAYDRAAPRGHSGGVTNCGTPCF